jgi:hypothetical protein
MKRIVMEMIRSKKDDEKKIRNEGDSEKTIRNKKYDEMMIRNEEKMIRNKKSNGNNNKRQK